MSAPCRRSRSRLASERGQALLETAIALPIVLFVAVAIFDRHNLVRHRRRRRRRAAGTELSRPTQPNALWCADYKGEFLTSPVASIDHDPRPRHDVDKPPV